MISHNLFPTAFWCRKRSQHVSGPTHYELWRPQNKVLERQIRDEIFATDLSKVLKTDIPKPYKNPALFFTNMHCTSGLM